MEFAVLVSEFVKLRQSSLFRSQKKFLGKAARSDVQILNVHSRRSDVQFMALVRIAIYRQFCRNQGAKVQLPFRLYNLFCRERQRCNSVAPPQHSQHSAIIKLYPVAIRLTSASSENSESSTLVIF
ncbi:hypothetical protein AVEN_158439-1 [Araneus ventricosus]|uniref:Uncharacterized protein n=1 Tax=Araneus ventricosus TaxID=182803 RepID=A0A4Y2E7M0_ARAVE|nr:hypothetical protein AVEN_274425-1 [Araneus ventricosus]GBO31791.1 hypothetical protein AVEN_158439-1 [Araneus ventricosus]